MYKYVKFNIKAATKTVTPSNNLTERCLCAEKASVKRSAKITSEPDTLRETGRESRNKGGTAVDNRP